MDHQDYPRSRRQSPLRGDFFLHPRQPPPSAASTSTPPTRPDSPDEDGEIQPASNRSPFAAPSRENPFTSPEVSRPVSSTGGIPSAVRQDFDQRAQRFFHSRRIKKGDSEKPWARQVDPKEKWTTILPCVAILIGLGVIAVCIWDGFRSVIKHKYCIVMQDDFSGGLDTNIWTHEIQVGGFGNGEFEETTDSEDNVFIANGNLVIKATLQDESLINKDTVMDLGPTGSNTCTGTTPQACIAATNTTAGNASIVPPTVSGRLITKGSATIKYGRVEVHAKMPVGDWLWPAIWMMPVEDTYGPWPASGEIDIFESRGNNHTYAQGGNNIASSALHWGPNEANDAWWLTNNKRPALHSTYSDNFHLFGLEWSEKYIFTYIDSRLLQVIYANFDTSLWGRGGFPATGANNTRLEDPWANTGRTNTPFDQQFFLILNLAVGGTNGWFEDSKSNKPWVDQSENAKKDFWNSRDQWFPTWTQPQMEIQRVSMWQQCDGNEDL